MSDNLVKQWDEYIESMGSVMGEVEHMAQQMRDRIEELEAKLKTADEIGRAFEEDAGQLREKLDSAEAKLAKAVELAFDECPFRDGTGSYGDWWHYRRKELEALKGQNDE